MPVLSHTQFLSKPCGPSPKETPCLGHVCPTTMYTHSCPSVTPAGSQPPNRSLLPLPPAPSTSACCNLSDLFKLLIGYFHPLPKALLWLPTAVATALAKAQSALTPDLLSDFTLLTALELHWPFCPGDIHSYSCFRTFMLVEPSAQNTLP